MKSWAMALLFGLAACRSTSSAAVTPDASYAIDKSFLFGGVTTAYQVEGGNHHSDWFVWEQVPLDGGSCSEILDCARADDGPDDYDQFQADLSRARGLGLSAHRLSLEWGRLQPNPPTADGGGYDPVAIAHYHEVLSACANLGMVPVVSLSHFTLPSWLHGVSSGRDGADESDWLGGWRGLPGETPGPSAQIVQAFGRFAADMATEYGPQVDLWLTIDEPMTWARSAYLDGVFPPGAQDHLLDFRNAVVNMAYAHAAAYDAIHQNDRWATTDGGTEALVGLAQELRAYLLPDASNSPNAGASDVLVQMEYVGNWLFPEAVINGNLDTHFDGSLDHPGDPAGEGQGLAALAGRLDFLGIDYYTTALVLPVDGGIRDAQDGGAGVPTLSLPAALAENADAGGLHGDPPQDAQIYPQGLNELILTAAQRYPLLPLYVTANGVADGAQPDVKRPAFLVEHVAALQQAMVEGADVRGYFYDGLLDGFQWNDGFVPRYGLFRVDFQDPARPRSATQGAAAYQQITGALGVTSAIRSEWVP